MHRRRPRLQHLPRPHQHPALRHPASHPAAGSTGHYHRTRLRACLLQALQLRCKEPLILWDPPGSDTLEIAGLISQIIPPSRFKHLCMRQGPYTPHTFDLLQLASTGLPSQCLD